ncbi:MAG: hypothetical protein PHI45_03065 [Candidatus Pacebacteria bacterium]|nr:hypothetical protein [Candidatus Paceibacterota bacterium]MDD5753034.1 hypothetical protein [Candidatus Paceibacterota bacterium]
MLLIAIIFLIILTIWGINFFSEKKLKEFNISIEKVTENFIYEKEKGIILNINNKYNFNDELLRNIHKEIKEIEKESKYSRSRFKDEWNNIQKLNILKIQKEERQKSEIYE